MNIQRYKMPVVIAAAIHGALFFCMPDTTVGDITLPPGKVAYREVPLVNEPLVQQPERSEDADATAASSAAKPLPSLPDRLEPLKSDDAFTVPMTPYERSIRPVETLIGYRGLPPGLADGPGGFGPAGIPDVGHLDRIPRAIVQTAPGYPDDMRRGGINGSVTVEFVVGLDGAVLKADAVKWSHREFVDPAVRAVLRWRFQPGTVEGRKVSFRMAVPIEFNAAR
jgi:protein TonB